MTRRIVEMGLGGFAVYVIMAACSASSVPPLEQSTSAGGTSGQADAASDVSSDGATGTGGVGGSIIDAAMDALADVVDAATDPVPDAMAAPPTVVTAKCTTEHIPPQGGSTQRLARADFPGKTVAELARVAAVIDAIQVPAIYPPDVTHAPTAPYLANGRAYVYCGAESASAPDWDQVTVTFVLP